MKTNYYRVGLCYRAGLIVIGAVCLGLGMVVLVALRTGHIQWARLVSLSGPMPASSAFGFLCGGLALLGISLRFPLAAVSGAVSAASIGLASLFGYLTGGLRVFEGLGGFARLYMGIDAGQRMAPNTTACLLLSGVAVLIRFTLVRKSHCFKLIALIGSAVFSIGMVAYVGYLSRFPTYCWIVGTPMSFLSSIGCILLGLGVVLSAWRYGELDKSGAPRWFPALLSTGIAVTGLCIARTYTIMVVAGAGRAPTGSVGAIGLVTAAGMVSLVYASQAPRTGRHDPRRSGRLPLCARETPRTKRPAAGLPPTTAPAPVTSRVCPPPSWSEAAGQLLDALHGGDAVKLAQALEYTANLCQTLNRAADAERGELLEAIVKDMRASRDAYRTSAGREVWQRLLAHLAAVSPP